MEDVQTIATQMNQKLAQVREKYHNLINDGKQEASNIVAVAKKQGEAIVAAAQEDADTLKDEIEKTRQSTEIIANEALIKMAEVEKKMVAMNVELVKWEEEKKRIASTHHFETSILLDVGGHTFTTTLTTLIRYPDTILGAMFSGRHALTKNDAGAYFIDRDGTHFRYILNFLRSPTSFGNSCVYGSTLTELMTEARYYGLYDHMFPMLLRTPQSPDYPPPSFFPHSNDGPPPSTPDYPPPSFSPSTPDHIPPFVPAEPVVMSTSSSGTPVIITQDHNQVTPLPVSYVLLSTH